MSSHSRYIFEALVPLLRAAIALAPSDTLYRVLCAALIHIERELGRQQAA